jgi:hypothetical protein
MVIEHSIDVNRLDYRVRVRVIDAKWRDQGYEMV